jgi:hypothetical protein
MYQVNEASAPSAHAFKKAFFIQVKDGLFITYALGSDSTMVTFRL